jgi:hypothetical protein
VAAVSTLMLLLTLLALAVVAFVLRRMGESSGTSARPSPEAEMTPPPSRAEIAAVEHRPA